jgi:hypothetical protein
VFSRSAFLLGMLVVTASGVMNAKFVAESPDGWLGFGRLDILVGRLN